MLVLNKAEQEQEGEQALRVRTKLGCFCVIKKINIIMGQKS